MAAEFETFDIDVSWSVYGDQDRQDVDRLLDSRPDLTAQQRSVLVSLWKRHPNRQLVGQQVRASPRMHKAVFILYCGDFIPLGTAFVVTSKSNTLLVTCAHCVCRRNEESGEYELEARPMFVTSKLIQEEDGRRHTDGRPIIPIAHVAKLDNACDLAVLQVTGHSFTDTIDMCPPEQMPTKDNEDQVKMYHVPLTLFPDETPVISSESLDYMKIAQESNNRYWVQVHPLPGSSGGPLLNLSGEVVGVLRSGYQPPLQLSIVVPRVMEELVEHMENGDENRMIVDKEDTYSTWSGHASSRLSAHYTQFVKLNVHGVREYVLEN